MVKEQDAYDILGVEKNDSDAVIKKAYRKLAMQYHPDKNQGDQEAEERFKDVAAAWNVVKPENRKKYDAGEMDLQGNAIGFGKVDFSPEKMGDLFSSFFDEKPKASKGNKDRSSSAPDKLDVRGELTLAFLEAARGTNATVKMSHNLEMNVKIPPGILNNQTIRVKGKGKTYEGKAGDAYIKIAVQEHPFFEREDGGNDIYLEVPVGLDEAFAGATIDVPTVHDAFEPVEIPAGLDTDEYTVTLEGHGIKGANQHVSFKIVVPEASETVDPQLEKALKSWRKKSGFDPRKVLNQSL